MAFYPQFPQAAIYAYPMPFPNQEFYAMYPPGSQAMEGSTVFYENNNYSSKKPGYNNRKESVQSTDSGLSDNSYASSYSSASSRKTSNVSATSASALSNLSITEEDSEVCITWFALAKRGQNLQKSANKETSVFWYITG